MLNQAWKDYQAWAKLARDLQSATGQWNLAALVCVVVAAACGAATTLFPADPKGTAYAVAVFAGAAALASAVGAYFGREILGSGNEANWIQARATAEAIESECFRYAARAGAYAVADDVEAAQALDRRTREIAQQARDKGLAPADGPFVSSASNPMPPASMDKPCWYKANRIGDDNKGQIKYYQDARKKNKSTAGRLWRVAFISGLAAVAFGALGATIAQHFAPWIGTMTTIAAAIAAWGLLDRRKHLIASYAATQSSLERILAMDDLKPASLADLVTTTEDLLESEHRAWLPQMIAMQHQPPTQPEQPQRPESPQQQGQQQP
jgi:hypothetical protein